MDELIRQLQEKTGLPVDKVQDVIETVLSFVADKLPGPIGDQVKGFIGDDAADGSGGNLLDTAKDALGGFGGLLGGKD